jgi:hypothetical protein
VAPEAQLEWEARAGRLAAAAAFVSAVVGVAAIFLASQVPQKASDDAVDSLFQIHRHAGPFVAGSILQAISIALLGPVLVFLYRATLHRRPEVPRAAYWLALLAPPAAGVLAIVGAIERRDAANKVVTTLSKHPLRPHDAIEFAKHQLTSGTPGTIGYVGLVVLLALAFAIGFNSIQARRAGLLSQFMGILGVIVAVLLVLPLFGQLPIVQYFWAVALGLLFLNRWPGGNRGPAWDTGEAVPWPTAAELRADREGTDPRAARREPRPPPRWLERFSGAGAASGGEGDTDAAEVEETPEPRAIEPTPHPRSKKRKKKRRR